MAIPKQFPQRSSQPSSMRPCSDIETSWRCTPLMLEIMLWHYVRAEPMPPRGEQGTEQTKLLVAAQMLKIDAGVPSGFEVTDRGRVWIKALLNTPLPVLSWQMPEPLPPLCK